MAEQQNIEWKASWRDEYLAWESSPLLQLTLQDIDDGIIKYFKEKALDKGRLEKEVLAETKEHFMEKLYLKNGDYLTNAAGLLFAEKPERWFLGAYIKVGFFESDAELIYQDEVHGSLLQQVDKALELIYFKYLKAKISYRGIQRVERYPFPEAALREALLNAVVHKDYSAGIPIQVSVYDDKLYIANVGRLPEMWTLANLVSKHTSQPFNPNIAHAFYLAGFIESWGRGIEKIYDACREDGIYDPEYTVHPRDIMIRFTAPEERVIYTRPRKATEKMGGVTERVTDRVTEPEQQVLAILIEEPACTYQALANRLSVSRKTVSSRIGSLKKKGMIRRVGSDTKGHWEIID